MPNFDDAFYEGSEFAKIVPLVQFLATENSTAEMLLFEATFCIIYGNRIKDYLALKGSTTSKEQMCSAKIRYKLRISVNSQETNDVCRGGDNGTQ